MGDALNDSMLRAFFEERELLMEKEAAGLDLLFRAAARGRDVARAGLGGMAKGQQSQWAEAAQRVIHPIQGLRKGWANYAPLTAMKEQLRAAREVAKKSGKPLKDVEDPIAKLRATSAAQKDLPWYALGRPGVLGKPKPGRLLSSERGHLLEQNVPLGQITKDAPGKVRAAGGVVKELASRASRGGWTGQGRMTKYMPVGGKGFTALYGASAAPGVIQAAKGGPVGQTGEGGGLEKGLGLAGGLAGWTAGAGMGIAPMLALGFGAEYAGEKFGRILDRVRSGASLRTAVTAPSPTKARKQLGAIQHYYGQPGLTAPRPPSPTVK